MKPNANASWPSIPPGRAWLSDPALAKLTLAGPKMPNSNWRVADIRRPQPPHVETGKACAAPPPGDAEVLFDGRDLSKWTSDRMEEWSLKDGDVTAGGRVYNFLRTEASVRRCADPSGMEDAGPDQSAGQSAAPRQ